MTKKDLVRVIREVVRKEIKSVVKAELNEALGIMEKTKQHKPPKQNIQYSTNKMLNEVLNSTANNETEEWPEISANTLRSKFMGMQDGAVPQTDINNRPVDVSNLDPSLNKALNRNYSELVKRFKK